MQKNNLRHLFRHSFIYSLGWAASVLAGIVMLPIYSKFLSRADYGAIDLVQQLNGVLKIVFMSGLNFAVSKFYHDAADEKGKAAAMSTSIAMIGMLAVAAAVSCLVFSQQLSLALFGTDRYLDLTRVGAVTLFFDVAFMGLTTQYFIAEKSGEFVKINLLKLATAIAANLYFVVWHEMGGIGMLYGNLISYLPVTAIAANRYFRSYGLSFDYPLLRRMFKFGLPLVPATLLATVMHNADRFLLRTFSSLDDVGLLTMGLNFPGMLNSVLLTSFNSIWLGSVMFKLDREADAGEQIGRISTYFMTLFCFLQTALGLFAPTVMHLLVDRKFFVAHYIIPIACTGYCFHAFYTFLTVGAYTKNKTGLMMYAYLVPVCFKFALSGLVVQRLGYVGSAWMLSLTYLVFAATCYFLFRRITQVRFEFLKLALLGISCGVALFCGSLVADQPPLLRAVEEFLLLACLALFLYFGPLLVREEREKLKTELRSAVARLRPKPA